MKKLLLITIMTPCVFAISPLTMSELQTMVNEDITDYFSTHVTNLAQPLSSEDIQAHLVKPTGNKGVSKVQTTVNAQVYNIESAEIFPAEYRCTTTIIDTGKVWKVSQTTCSANQEI